MIYAHRGLWNATVKQNSLEAILTALEQGFSVETDIRDFAGELRISHDPAQEESPKWFDLLRALEFSQKTFHNQTFALNVKSDGLIPLFRKAGDLNSPHFFFDFSVPEGQRYVAEGFPLAARFSEYETNNTSYARNPTAVWLDGFREDWFIDSPVIESFMRSNPAIPIILVSPELHGRDFDLAWSWLKMKRRDGGNISICTDHPYEVEEFLSGTS
jgi:glycerophosphoryl diester phosphodiesterase